MLEKIGLPARPSLRGNSWVVDASHCQGCSSQFTFMNRKHHCRRCGGIFCNGCTQQRMFLRGQGDSPVRICEPCKKLEEVARFEMRHGHKSRARKGSSKLMSNPEDDVLNKILDSDNKDFFQSARESNNVLSSFQRETSSSSSSNVQNGEEVFRSISIDGSTHLGTELASDTPEELRQQALDEKSKYKALKGERKSEEALKAFKRAKELERKADALELYLRKSRRKSLLLGNMSESVGRDQNAEFGTKAKIRPPVEKEKQDLTTELRELGWSDMDLHDEDNKTTNMSLEGELSSLLRGVSEKTNKEDRNFHRTDNSQVIALKRKALMLKREGKLAEAKEELKRAKVLEKQLEEQELLAGSEDSDDELSALIRSMDDAKQEEFSSDFKHNLGVDFNNLLGAAEDLLNSSFEVTNEDMEDPEIASALESLGWTEDSSHAENIVPGYADKESLKSEVISLKREAVKQKRAGNIAEAMSLLKKAKMRESDLENFDSHPDSILPSSQDALQKVLDSQTADKPSTLVNLGDVTGVQMQGIDFNRTSKSRMMIQKELLGLKKTSLALRREGKLDEAEEELKKGRVLKRQLEQMDNAPKANAITTQVSVSAGSSDGMVNKHLNTSKNLYDEEVLGDVTDQDLQDPTYLSLLKNLGWNDEDDELVKRPSKSDKHVGVHSLEVNPAPNLPVVQSKRTKAEVQRELLGLKRKALALRRQGNIEDSEEMLQKAKVLDGEIEAIESRSREAQFESTRHQENIRKVSLVSADEEGDEEDVTENDMHDPTLLVDLKNLGWKDEEIEPVTKNVKSEKESFFVKPSVNQSSSKVSAVETRNKSDIQRELLSLKRKALALRRKGEIGEAEEVLEMAKVLETQLEELEAPKETVLRNISKKNESETISSLDNNEKKEDAVEAVEKSKGYKEVTMDSKDNSTGLSLGSRGIAIDTDSVHLPSSSPDISIPITSQLIGENQPLFVDVGASGKTDILDNMCTTEGTTYISPPGNSVDLVDLLTGDDWKSPQGETGKPNEFINHSPNQIQLESTTKSYDRMRNKDNGGILKQKVRVVVDQKTQGQEDSSQEIASQTSKSSLRQEIFARKRKAVALKREGKLAEAREELRRAKLLEKSFEENDSRPEGSSSDLSIPASIVPAAIDQKEHGSSVLAPKPVSSRNRFKLQQESLSHKRQALKLRREGRTQEADAEFELAKALETQLEELDAHGSAKSSVDGADSIDDLSVEDFLDPQLLSALKAIGLDEPSTVSRSQKVTEPVKLNVSKSENSNLERTQLEERIKAEKVKAVNLKRSGKQGEALDALRRVKLLEKKLDSLGS